MRPIKYKLKCPVCGERTMEEHGTEPGDHHWYFCRTCGQITEDEQDESSMEP